jgi:hypothetical protein
VVNEDVQQLGVLLPSAWLTKDDEIWVCLCGEANRHYLHTTIDFMEGIAYFVVVALKENIWIMAEIDTLIPAWPIE